jgi:hypothetical protein
MSRLSLRNSVNTLAIWRIGVLEPIDVEVARSVRSGCLLLAADRLDFGEHLGGLIFKQGGRRSMVGSFVPI